MEPTEIPNRLLGELRLSAESVDNIANMDSSLIFSPDEFFLRQRGRRRTTVWSPDTVNTQVNSPFQRTPTKILSSSMILRSSPRKRLTLGSTPTDSTDDRLCSPIKTAMNVRTQLWGDTPSNAKKPRLAEKECLAIARQNNDIPLSTILKGYSKSQLIELLQEQVDNKTKEEQFRNRLPTPSIDLLENELQHAKRNIYKSLPTSRLCKKTDSVAYSRASLHLNEFKRLLSQHTKELQESSHYDALLDYVIMSWPYVRATPVWENAPHNALRRQCFKLLTYQCITAIKAAGLRLGSERLCKLEKNLQDWSKDYEDVLSCISTLNRTLSKGRTSL